MQIKRHNFKRKKNAKEGMKKIIMQEKERLVDLMITIVITIIEKNKTPITEIKKRKNSKKLRGIVLKKWTKKFLFRENVCF